MHRARSIALPCPFLTELHGPQHIVIIVTRWKPNKKTTEESQHTARLAPPGVGSDLPLPLTRNMQSPTVQPKIVPQSIAIANLARSESRVRLNRHTNALGLVSKFAVTKPETLLKRRRAARSPVRREIAGARHGA